MLLKNLKKVTKREVEWRKRVFARDKYTCQEPKCKQKGGYLEAHHIKKKFDYPELKYVIDNGITLCRKCHEKTFFNEKKFEKKYIRINNKMKNYAIPKLSCMPSRRTK